MHAIVEDKPVESVRSLIIANLIAVVLAIFEGWQLRELMFVYWAQSVIIGFFSFRRMLDLKSFSTDGVKQNGRAVQPTEKTKKSMAGFFAFHYGFFHFVYLIFLLTDYDQPFQGSLFFLGLCVVVFFINHRFSYIQHRENDALRRPNIGTIMFFPYARIIPMHITIIIGGAMGHASLGAMLLFLTLKTLADVIMHKVEHHSGWRSLPGSSH